MNLNPPRAVRAVLYLIGTLGIIAVQWANDKHWLDSPDRTALAAVLALIMALATANTLTPSSNEGPPRDDRGSARPLFVGLVALLFAIGGALVMASPAQAYGWSGQKCDNQAAANASKVCIQVHTAQSGSGVRVDQAQVCAYKVPQLYYNGFRGTKGNTVQFYGSGGAYLGFVNLADTGASVGGTCSYTNMSFQMGNQACYRAYGTEDLAGANDQFWIVHGYVSGAAGDC